MGDQSNTTEIEDKMNIKKQSSEGEIVNIYTNLMLLKLVKVNTRGYNH